MDSKDSGGVSRIPPPSSRTPPFTGRVSRTRGVRRTSRPSGETPQRRRGRPRGSGSGTKKEVKKGEGADFKVHIITVEKGQDICSAIERFSLQGRRRVIILSASGIVSYATLRHKSPDGPMVYIGPCYMLSLTCSLGESGIGCFTSSISWNRGEMYGGVVDGALIAATPIQVLLGTFVDVDEVNEPSSSTLPEDQVELINLISSSEED